MLLASLWLLARRSLSSSTARGPLVSAPALAAPRPARRRARRLTLTLMSTHARARQVAEVAALRRASRVLALAGAMDQRAALERAAEAGRRRFVRGLVDEARAPRCMLRRARTAVLASACPGLLGVRDLAALQRPGQVRPWWVPEPLCVQACLDAPPGLQGCRQKPRNAGHGRGDPRRRGGRCRRCARWAPCWRRARAARSRATWPRALSCRFRWGALKLPCWHAEFTAVNPRLCQRVEACCLRLYGPALLWSRTSGALAASCAAPRAPAGRRGCCLCRQMVG